VALAGGALVFGALRRIMRRPRLSSALLMGIGFAVLANSRPYEGLLVSLPAALLLFIWMLGRNGPQAQVSVKRIVLPLGGVVVFTAVAMGLYNWRVTGDPLLMPYQVHEATYAIAPNFLWHQPWPEPAYRHKVMRDGNLSDLERYTERRAAGIRWILYPWSHSKFRYLPYPILLAGPLVLLALVLRDRWSRFALLTCSVLVVGLIMETYFFLHYAAPMMALLFALVLQAMRHLRLWQWRRWRAGQLMVSAIVTLCFASFLAVFAQQLWVRRGAEMPARTRIRTQLNQAQGRHLVLVRYGPSHLLHEDWVYNEADIDKSKVVWARDMDRAHNRKLLDYFKDRQVWLVEVGNDHVPPEPRPYPVTSAG
jgi:hypothetical protein